MKLFVQCVTDWMRMEGIFSSSASVCANFDVAFEEKQIQLLDFSSAQHVLKEIWKLNEDLQTEMLDIIMVLVDYSIQGLSRRSIYIG